MAIAVLMPALSPTMTEGNLAKWVKKEGDKIKPGEVIAEIETDKATMEVESADAGILGKILVSDKTNAVKVNQLIAIILEAGDGKKEIDSIISKHSSSEKQIEVKVSPIEQSHTPQLPTKESKQIVLSGNRIIASPLAKRIAQNNGVNLSGVRGTGPNGRIVKDDVLNAPSGSHVQQIGRNPQEYYTEPHTNMRKIIAKRLLESKTTVPHFYLSVDCNIDSLLQLREQINLKEAKSKNPRFKISVNDFIIKASAAALKENPKANASWTDDNILVYNNVDISVAVAIDDGLITPIIRNADQKSLSQISIEMKELAAKAKSNLLSPQEFQGGGFSISNLGMYGIKNFSAIINPPQSCILAVGAAEKKVIVKPDGQFTASNIMSITISCDHRIVDGSVGAELIQSLKAFLEQPALMFV